MSGVNGQLTIDDRPFVTFLAAGITAGGDG